MQGHTSYDNGELAQQLERSRATYSVHLGIIKLSFGSITHGMFAHTLFHQAPWKETPPFPSFRLSVHSYFFFGTASSEFFQHAYFFKFSNRMDSHDTFPRIIHEFFGPCFSRTAPPVNEHVHEIGILHCMDWNVLDRGRMQDGELAGGSVIIDPYMERVRIRQ